MTNSSHFAWEFPHLTLKVPHLGKLCSPGQTWMILVHIYTGTKMCNIQKIPNRQPYAVRHREYSLYYFNTEALSIHLQTKYSFWTLFLVAW